MKLFETCQKWKENNNSKDKRPAVRVRLGTFFSSDVCSMLNVVLEEQVLALERVSSLLSDTASDCLVLAGAGIELNFQSS